jgi:hypothetical protein
VRWQLTVRAGPKVKKQAFSSLDEALTALEDRARELTGTTTGEAYDAKIRRFEAAEVVAARLELAGPERFVASVRAGVDVHADGSVEAYRGRVRRQAIEPRRGETIYAALRRAVEEEAPDGSSQSTLT